MPRVSSRPTDCLINSLFSAMSMRWYAALRFLPSNGFELDLELEGSPYEVVFDGCEVVVLLDVLAHRFFQPGITREHGTSLAFDRIHRPFDRGDTVSAFQGVANPTDVDPGHLRL